MIGPEYRSRAAQAVLGPSRSALIPSVLWVGWLNGSGDLIAMSGTSVPQTIFGPSGDGVTNVADIDAGVAGTGWTIAGVGLYDSATAGDVVATADLPAPVSPPAGDTLVIATGDLVFTVA